MKLKVVRDTFTDKTTIGKLFVDEVYQCNTLEDVVRKGVKVYGQTAIPEGLYEVVIDYSNHFQREMPHILNVPGFEGIRIHSGNNADDTEGCILLGLSRKTDWVGQSRTAFEQFFPILEAAYEKKEPITIEVTSERN